MTDNPLNSRAILAAEIADSVRREVRAQQSAAQLSATIEKSLLEEARRAELKLAYLRGGAAAAFSIFVLGRLFLSRISSIPPPTTGSLGAALLWMTFAAAALAVLRRDWYKPWLRRGFPIADATLLIIGLGLSQVGADPFAMPPGLSTTFAVLCVVLAFTGAFRLTQSAVKLTAALAVIALLLTAAVRWLPWLAAGGSVVAVALSGALALSVTDMIRRVVINEVSRATLDQLF